MLKIRFGTTDNTIINVDDYFDFDYEDEWFNDPLVKEMVKSVDLSEILSPSCIQSPILGQISPTEISGGVKALILMLKTDEEIWATACGNNCSDWILKISEIKDITISLEHFMNFTNNHFPFIDAETGVEYSDYFEQILERGY